MSMAVRDIGPKIAVALLIGGIVVAALVEGRDSVPEGDEAPAFVLQTYDGGTVKLDELRGKLVLLNFWATWCSPCVEEMPYFVTLAKKYESKGLRFIAVSADDEDSAKEDVKAFAQKTGIEVTPYVAFHTDAVLRTYSVKAYPTTVLVGVDG